MSRLVVCADCGQRKPHLALGLCGACYTRQRRRDDPVIAERDRKASRAWKDHNRERKRAYDREHTMDGQCGECGGPIKRECDGRRCGECIQRATRERHEAICAMWADGLSLREIAAALGTTANSIGVTIVHMRADGWDLPYRYARRAKAAA